jgi:exo-1,4-beta-D-glucosaminidase
LILVVAFAGSILAQSRVDLIEWQLQTSGRISDSGAAISLAGYATQHWLPTQVPSTVLATEVAQGLYPDPYHGMNLRAVPGTTYDIGKMFNRFPMDPNSPYARPWWYRTEFTLPAGNGKNVVVHFDGINYRANIWINGNQLASSTQVAGAYRTYAFDITTLVHPGKNAVAVEVSAPTEKDLAVNWVDWNPTPPDKNMGLWRGVWISTYKAAQISDVQVVSKVDPATLAAELTVVAGVANSSDNQVKFVLTGSAAGIPVRKQLTVAAHQTQRVTFTPTDTPALKMAHPKLWWPWQMGESTVHDLDLQLHSANRVLDEVHTTFGIREVTSELTDRGARLFRVNGKPILIRGGGWSPDMLLRESHERVRRELELAKDMGLNTIRLEGKMESDYFYDLADRMGLLVMAGWSCCDMWEVWRDWGDEQKTVALESVRSQAMRMRDHPSVFVWLDGSDNPPVAEIEQAYDDVLRQVNWPNPVLSSASAKPSSVTGASGVKMSGPYDYVPPEYWYADTSRFGGGWGFNTETSPGAAIPPVESLKKFLPQPDWWPVDAAWSYHAGSGVFAKLDTFNAGLAARYGAASSLDEYARKSQAMAYDGERAMFEAYSRNKYTSTGLVQWMLNNAWPSIIWHLYDYYLMPAGGYFGTKKALEPLHLLYSYDDHSIAVVNSTYETARGLKVSARVLNFNLAEKFSREATVDVAADGVVKAFTLPQIDGLTRTYFVTLSLSDASGKRVSDNFYWLSTKNVTLDWAKTLSYVTPVIDDADMTMLNSLPKATVTLSESHEQRGDETLVHVRLKNTSKKLAFMIRARVLRADGDDVLPVFWSDDYVSLLPGEARELSARVETKELRSATPRVVIDGWNIVTNSAPAAAKAVAR